MHLRISKFRHLVPAVFLLAGLAACEQYQPRSSAIQDTLGSVSFDPPARSELPPPTVRADGQAPGASRRAETYFGGATPNGGAVQAQRAVDGIRLNFDGGDVREVARVILSDLLGKSYTIDPQITGEVVLSSSGPLSDSDLLTVLETILRMHGGTLVQQGDIFAIQAIGETQGSSQIATLGGTTPPAAAPGLGFTVVPLRFMTADAAAQFVQPLVSRPELIRVDSTRNLLLFSGTSAERQTVLDTLYDVDVDWMAGRSVGIFPLSMSSPESMIPELEALFGPLDANGLRSETIRFMPMARLNAVLVIANQPAQLSRAKTWVERLDRGNTVGTQFYVYQLQHVPAADMAELLTESITGIEDPKGETPSAAIADELNADPFAAVPQDAALVNGFTGTTRVGAAASSASLNSVKIVPNNLNNTLLIRAAPQAYEMIEATLRRLDTAPLQVLIEATIAEVTLNDQLRYGVQYFLNAGNFKGGFNTTTVTSAGIAAASQLSPLARLPGFNFVFTPGSSNITLDALARITDVKVLSSPSLVVQDNSEAVLNVGDEVPIVTRSAANVENNDGVVVNNIEYRDTGVILEVKPRISSNSMVSMEIGQEVSRVATETTTQSDSLTPTISQRKINSTINVLSGQTVVLGGLIQDSETRSKDKVPLLGDVPILGNLFQNNNTQTTRTELVVFITPRIIRNAEDARDVSNELRSRMRSVSPLPTLGAPGAGPADDNSPGLPTPLPAPSAGNAVAPNQPASADVASNGGSGGIVTAPAVSQTSSPGDEPSITAQIQDRQLLPVPQPAPVIPKSNPNRPPRIALPLPENLTRILTEPPVPSLRPAPGFRLNSASSG